MQTIPETKDVHPEQRELARVFSSVWLYGPPMGSELLALISHLFSPEEAGVAKHLSYYIPVPVKTVARRAKEPVEKVKVLLDAMADKRVIFRSKKQRYAILPLIPGMFEYLLMGGEDSPWHREYGRLINALYATGYTRRYSTTPSPLIRNIPLQQAIEHKSMRVDADLVEKMIQAHEHLAVLKVCQCRQSRAFEGRSCSRSEPDDGCLVFGTLAESVVEQGMGRFVTRAEMDEIVKDRWEKNLVFMTANLSPSSSNAICTCCDCCCHYIESINHFNGRVSLAEPHYLALMDEEFCTNCGKCAKVCNTHAHTLTLREHAYNAAQCIGCGQCVPACPQDIISLQPNPGYKAPSKSWLSFGLRVLPSGMLSSLKALLWKG